VGLADRQILQHGFFDARFDPHSYVFFCSELYRQLDAVAITGAFFKHRVNDPVIVNATGQFTDQVDASRFHELCHWYQFGGTTIGANLTLTQYLRDSSGVSNFSSLAPRERRAIIQKRNLGVPLIPLVNDYHCKHDKEYSDRWTLSKQIWYDYTLYHAIMLDGVPIEHMQNMPFLGRLVGEVNGDLIVMRDESYDEKPLRDLERYGIESKNRFRVSQISLVGSRGELITTADIMEANAVLNELFYLNAGIPDKKRRSKLIAVRLGEMQTEKYNRVIRYLCDIFHIEFDLSRLYPSILLTFTALCDISLNPPLPPFVLVPSTHHENLWEEVYPPHRLRTAASAARCFGFLDGMLVSDKIEHYQRAVCDLAKLTCHWDYTDPWPCTELLELSRVEWSEEFVSQNDADIYFKSLQKALWRIRLENPGFLFLPCYYEFMESAFQHKIFIDYAFREGLYLHPIVMAGRDGRFTYYSSTKDAANWFALRMGFLYACQSIFLHSGDIHFSSGFPRDLFSNENFMESLKANIQENFPGLTIGVV
jgi:hypothetical protein